MYLKETEIGYIQPSELRYTDIESPNSEILFTITTPPYFVYNRGERDAGRLVKAHNISSLNKDTDVSTGRKKISLQHSATVGSLQSVPVCLCLFLPGSL